MPRSLKCLAATAVKNKIPKEFCHDVLPKTLKQFVDMHG